MAQFILRRVLFMIPTMFVISIVAFVVIQLPPGDYLTSYVASLSATGEQVQAETIEALEARFGLGQPMHVQYMKWISNIILKGDFGQSFTWNSPVENLIWGRLGLTVLISVATLIFTWIIAFPVGIYSAVNKYSLGDYIATFFGFLGLAVPQFLAGARSDVHRLQIFQSKRGRVVFTRICRCTLEYRESPRFIEPSLDSHDYPWPGWRGQSNPDYACQFAR